MDSGKVPTIATSETHRPAFMWLTVFADGTFSRVLDRLGK